ncbi:MAG: hypothetical protein R3D82_06175 [Xanthobacteraceae bacterium]
MIAETTVRRFPTRLHLVCGGCGRERFIAIFLEQVKKLRCSECGSHQVDVKSRDRLGAWSRRRRGR